MEKQTISTRESGVRGQGSGISKKKKGFTLVELVLVIILIAILASIAVPRFVNLSRQADIAATRGALGAVRGAMVMDYASRTLVARGVAKFANVIYHSWFMELDIPVNEIANTSRVANAGLGADDAVVVGEAGQIAVAENMDAISTPSAANLLARTTALAASPFCCTAGQPCVAGTVPTIGWAYESSGDYEGVVKPCGDNSSAAGFTDDTADVW